MIQSEYKVQVIEPSEGFTLTQKEDVELTQRFFSKKIFLAVNDNVENYKEIPDSEAEAMKQEQQKLIEENYQKELMKQE